MNIIFGLVILISSILLLIFNPDALLSSMLSGGEKALELTLKLVVIYAVWMGIFSLLEKTGLANKFAKLLKPVNRFLFGDIPDKANDFMSLNISANILGMSGITTPMGIKSIQELEKHPNTDYAITMFFVINATSIQLIPTSVMALRTSLGAISPGDIILPTVITTLLSTVIGIILVKVFVKKQRKCPNTLSHF